VTLAFDLAVRRGEFALELALEVPSGVTVLFGPSGAGKSLTLAALAGLVPASGRITLDGRTLLDGTTALPPHARRIGLVPQEGLLFPHMNVRANLRYGGEQGFFRGRGGGAPEFEQVVSVLELAPLLDRSPRDLSGGERQRVALGRALLAGPGALLLDEPLAALDRERRARIVPYLRRVKERFAIPVLYVTHALDEALALGDRACVLAEGKKVVSGPPLEVFGSPRQELVPRLTGFENVLSVEVKEHVPADGVTIAHLGGARLGTAEVVIPASESAPGTRVFLGLAANDVVLATEEPRGISARNVLAATVSELEIGPSVLVRLDVGGAPLVARLVPSAVRALALAPGVKVFAIVKTSSLARLDLEG
jgi:molybdate transport system ATP-binding protein